MTIWAEAIRSRLRQNENGWSVSLGHDGRLPDALKATEGWDW
jgi:hypothetical protein